MQKVGSNSQPLGICQRLINFVLSLLSRSVAQSSLEEVMSKEEGSSRNGKSGNTMPPMIKPNDCYSGSDIEVEFRHFDGSENWRQIDDDELERTDRVHSPKKDGLVLSRDHHQAIHQEPAGSLKNRGKEGQNHSVPNHSPDKKNGTRTRGKEVRELEGLSARGEVPIKNVTVTNIEDETFKRKDGNVLAADDQATKMDTINEGQGHEDLKPRPPRRLGPLLSVASNINEKSDAYINSRKKAMRRNYSLDPEISKKN